MLLSEVVFLDFHFLVSGNMRGEPKLCGHTDLGVNLPSIPEEVIRQELVNVFVPKFLSICANNI